MIENQSWSLSIGRWGSVSLRVHMLFLLAVIVIFGAEWNHGVPNVNFFSGTALVTSMALLLAVLLHQTVKAFSIICTCLLYTSPSPRDRTRSRMPSSA